jgi:hypothetical protein
MKTREKITFILGNLMISISGNSLIKLREKIEEFNSLLYIRIKIKVFANNLLLSTEFCLLADRINESNNDLYIIIVLVSFMLCAAMNLLALCRSSQNIIDSMESMIKATELRIAFTYLSSEDYKKAKLIVGMRTNFRYSSSTLFVLKTTTTLMILSYVANYAVILIQTSGNSLP